MRVGLECFKMSLKMCPQVRRTVTGRNLSVCLLVVHSRFKSNLPFLIVKFTPQRSAINTGHNAVQK